MKLTICASSACNSNINTFATLSAITLIVLGVLAHLQVGAMANLGSFVPMAFWISGAGMLLIGYAISKCGNKPHQLPTTNKIDVNVPIDTTIAADKVDLGQLKREIWPVLQLPTDHTQAEQELRKVLQVEGSWLKYRDRHKSYIAHVIAHKMSIYSVFTLSQNAFNQLSLKSAQEVTQQSIIPLWVPTNFEAEYCVETQVSQIDTILCPFEIAVYVTTSSVNNVQYKYLNNGAVMTGNCESSEINKTVYDLHSQGIIRTVIPNLLQRILISPLER